MPDLIERGKNTVEKAVPLTWEEKNDLWLNKGKYWGAIPSLRTSTLFRPVYLFYGNTGLLVCGLKARSLFFSPSGEFGTGKSLQKDLGVR
eukprot:scaffold2806_cov178-Amphora_coffeaeformis.AAC.5